ncbi:MAG: rhomboid family intramembrane serine protease [Alphaproteobacteria bacterium]|nr:rhomboid family intramembrane serine protease [Alphaproteobacteria bacterium]
MARTPTWFPLVGHSIAADDIRRPPRVATVLLAVMAAVQVVAWILPAEAQLRLMGALGASLFAQDGTLLPLRLYSLFTSWAVHDGIFHLLFNALWIVAFGRTVVRHLGPVGFVVFFLATSAIGSIAGLAAHWGEPAVVIGASGAVFGLIGAGAYVLTQGVSVARKIGAMAAYVAIFMALNLGFALMGGESFGVEGAISWEAHTGGLAAGLVLFPIIAALRTGRRGPIKLVD